MLREIEKPEVILQISIGGLKFTLLMSSPVFHRVALTLDSDRLGTVQETVGDG